MKFKQALFIITIVLTITNSSFINHAFSMDKSITLLHQENVIYSESEPLIIEGRVLLPLRFVSENLGNKVFWDEEERKATVESNVSKLEFWADYEGPKVNGISQDIDVPAQIVAGRFFVPLRFLLEHSGYNVFYEAATRSVIVEKDNNIDTPRVKIISFAPATGEHYRGERALSSLEFMNTGEIKKTFWLGYSVKNPAGEWYDIPAHTIDLEPRESTFETKEWIIPEESLISGDYDVIMAVWDQNPSEIGAKRLAQSEMKSSFQAFNFLDTFEKFDPDRWKKTNHPLGKGLLDPENIIIRDGHLHLIKPANTYDGASIETHELKGYGSYRASIKVADAPCSITGFFLYLQPDYYHEIDIEIYNDPIGKVMFTTYAQGETTNTIEKDLGFDPTAGFHEYRFDYYSTGVDFYVNGKLMQSWQDGLTDQPMSLMINSWFPNWLKGEKNSTDKITYVDWIKH